MVSTDAWGSPFASALESVTETLRPEGFGLLTHVDVRAAVKDKLGEGSHLIATPGACNPSPDHPVLTNNACCGSSLPCNGVADVHSGGIRGSIADPEVLPLSTMAENAVVYRMASKDRARLERIAVELRTS